jgi:AsmA-like protein
MLRSVNRRIILGMVLILLLGTFVPPLINFGRFRFRVADALGNALGRSVSVGAVHLRLVPRPGLDIEKLVVQDDPAFSAEPLLRADQVTAALRLTSLWRGRLEIASLSLSYPSLNLVRAPNGHWNLEPLLERARQIPTAPTPLRSAEARPRFPYLEAKGGRINLKIGQEKTVYALSEANFALSLPSENLWQLQLTARPMRTDANLSDTGSVRISGSIQRGSTLADTPLDLRVALDGAQLGQLSTLVQGRDRGWRGNVNVSATLRGTPAALEIAGDAAVDDFRRYDIATSGSLRLAAHCSGGFSTSTQQFTGIACRAPVGGGALVVLGTVDGILPLRGYSLLVTGKDLPAASLLALSRRMKKDLPDDLQASGSVNVAFDLQPDAWTGSGTTSSVRLSSRLSAPLEVGRVELALGIPPPPRGKRNPPAMPPVTMLRVSQFPLDLGGAMPARVQAWLSHDAYSIELQGDTRINHLLELAHALGVRAPQAAMTGLATTDLHLAGRWTGFAAPVVTGDLRLHSVTAAIPGIAAPLQITTAALQLTPDVAEIDDLAAGFSGTHLNFTGSVQAPKDCPTSPCLIAFQLHAERLSTDELNAVLNPRAHKRPWYAILRASPQPSMLPKLSAAGTVSAARLEIKSLVAKRASGDVRLESGVLTVTNLRAEVLGGSAAVEFRGDFTGAQPAYTIDGALRQASMGAVSALMRDPWATGKANATCKVQASGWDAAQLRASANGFLRFDWRDGSLAHVALNSLPAPLLIRQFHGELAVASGQLTFQPSKLETPGGIYLVSGTASFDRQLGLRLMRGKTEGFDITGTIEKPQVTPAASPATQAVAFKP